MAQIVELHAALEKIKADTGRWNKSLATLKLEQQAGKQAASHAKLTQQEKTPQRCRPLRRRSRTVILARLAGFEPTTPWFVAKYSIQLSYGRATGEL